MNLRILTIATAGILALSLRPQKKPQDPSELNLARFHFAQCKKAYDAAKARPGRSGVGEAARALHEAQTAVVRLELAAKRVAA